MMRSTMETKNFPSETSGRVKWKKGSLIRHRKTGHPLLVLQVHQFTATLVVDLESKDPMATTYALLPGQYNNYALEEDMVMKNGKWEYSIYE